MPIVNSPALGQVYGSPEHAAVITEGRHPGVRDALQWLTFTHLPAKLQRYSGVFYAAAVALIETILTDSPELTTALNRLIESKDSAVRAGIRHDTGRAGSVPRPQTVVDPPKLNEVKDLPGGMRGVEFDWDDPDGAAKAVKEAVAEAFGDGPNAVS